jgi:hypothetical protein
MLGDSEELPVSCLYMVKPTDNGNLSLNLFAAEKYSLIRGLTLT